MIVVSSYCELCYPPGYMVCTYVPIYSMIPSPSLIEDKTHMNTIYRNVILIIVIILKSFLIALGEVHMCNIRECIYQEYN